MSMLSALASTLAFGGPKPSEEPDLNQRKQRKGRESSADDSLSYSSDSCVTMFPDTFDDWDALESGEAREFIPTSLLRPHSRWWQCRVVREDKMRFTMYLEKRREDEKDRFLLSAKRVGDEFFISRYESFPGETPLNETPTRRFCAVIRRQPGRNHNFTLRPHGGGSCSQQPLVTVSHSFVARQHAEMRTVEALLPSPQDLQDLYVWDRPITPITAVDDSCSICSDSSADSSVHEDIHIANQIPTWNELSQCLVMKFQRNRIRASSSKNVLLFRTGDLGDGFENGDPDLAIMQFGKVAKGHYALDFKNPISPIQAFTIALSSFTYKI